MHPPTRFAFGVGNLLTAALLFASLFVLPVRYWLVDGSIGVVAAILLASSVWLLARLRGAERAGRIAAFALLGFGLLAVGLALLTLSFLSGVHGRWLDAGLPWSILALALLAPYTVVYPLWQLFSFGAAPGSAAESGAKPSSAAQSGATESDTAPSRAATSEVQA